MPTPFAARPCHAGCALTLLAAAALSACHSTAGLNASSPATASPVGSVEHGGAACTDPALPPLAALPSTTALPDPFVMANGTRLTRKAEWACRRHEVSRQLQAYELGEKPAPVAGSVTAKLDGKTLAVTVSSGGRSISFNANVQLPTTGQAPYPAVIGIGRSFLNNAELLARGVAIIDFPNNDIADQQNGSSRNQGKFFALHPQAQGTGALVAWAWGVSRLVDALEQGAAPMLDAKHLAVTGCSRNGKGALMAGALDERIALTIPQESGSGGSASWRVSDAQKAAGQNVQTLRQIVTENVWFRSSFGEFSEAATRLPFDHHQVMALVAPRGLLVIENTAMEWLGNQSGYVTALAAREAWVALGVADRMGVSQFSHPDHCRLPASQAPEVLAFVDRFLRGLPAATSDIVRTDGSFAVDRARWMPWGTPALK